MSSTARLRLRRDTASAWTAANPVLLLGEVGIETDTRNFKVGNGSSAWSALSYYLTAVGSVVRGQVSKMDAGTIVIATQSVYVSTGLTGTFDTATATGMTLGTVDAFAVKNTSGTTRLMQIYGSIDAKTATGNNKVLGHQAGQEWHRHRSNRVPRFYRFRRGGSQARHQLDHQHGRQR